MIWEWRIKNKIKYGVLICISLLCTSLADKEAELFTVFSCEKNEYLLGEPIWAIITVSNNLNHPVEFNIGYGPDDSFLFSAVVEGNTVTHESYPTDYFLIKESLATYCVYTRKVLLTSYLEFEQIGKHEIICKTTFSPKYVGMDVKMASSLSDEIFIIRDEESLKALFMELSKGLHDEEASSRWHTIDVMASTKNSNILKYIEPMMRDKDEFVARGAVHAVSRIGTIEAEEILRTFISSNQNESIKNYATWHLERLLKNKNKPVKSPDLSK